MTLSSLGAISVVARPVIAAYHGKTDFAITLYKIVSPVPQPLEYQI